MDSALYQLGSLAQMITSLCHRLEGHVCKSRDSPIARLAQQEVMNLRVEGKALAGMLPSLCFGQTDEENTLLLQPSIDITERMGSVREQIIRAVSILDFARRNKQNTTGVEDEELDAIFASVFLLDNTPVGADGDDPPHMKIKYSQLLSGLCKHVVLPDKMCPETQEWADKTLSQLNPRYVRMYPREDDVPYTIDRWVDPRSGSFGTVHKTVNKTGDGVACAVKVFRNVSWNNRKRRDILREIGVLELCMHRNIVKLVEAYEVATLPDMLYVVMAPWVPTTLDDLIQIPDRLRHDKFPWFEAGTESTLDCCQRVMAELADGLAYLHRMSLKHKDLKPNNILLQHAADAQKITPLITDFGVSKLNHQESSLKSDIWQLGCCFSYMLCVASGGYQAANALQESYMCDLRACNIAQEAGHFKKALRHIVVHHGLEQKLQKTQKQARPREREERMLHIVADGMLDLDPSTRLDIDMVCGQMARL